MSSPPRQAVFFDCTGTIYDPDSDQIAHVETAREIVRHFRLNVTPESLTRRFAWMSERYMARQGVDAYVSADELLRAILSRFSAIFQVDKNEENYHWIKETTRLMHRRHARLIPGVRETLGKVRKMGYHVGLVSHMDRELLADILECLEVVPLIDTVTSAEEIELCRPDPLVFLHALKKAGIGPEHGWFVGGDPVCDMQGARAVGLRTVFYAPDDPEGEEWEADHRIRSLPELVEILDTQDPPRPLR